MLSTAELGSVFNRAKFPRPRQEPANMHSKNPKPPSFKDKCVDALLISVVLISLSGVVYSLWHQ